MKVGDDQSVVNLENYIKNSQDSEISRPFPKQEQEKPTQMESVKLSTMARELQTAREVLDATPEVREEKVGQFKREIEAGTYDMRGDKVAGRMLKESLIDSFI